MPQSTVKRVSSFLHPVDHGGQDAVFKFCFVTYEVIVNKKETAPPSCLEERFQFIYYLPGGFASRPVSVKSGNITKLTAKRTAPGILNTHGEISFHLEKLPERRRGLCQIGKDCGRVKVGGFTQGKVLLGTGEG